MDGVLKVIDMLGLTIADFETRLDQANKVIQAQQAEIERLKSPIEPVKSSE